MQNMILVKTALLGSVLCKAVLPPMIPLAMFATDMINEQTATPLTIVAAVGGGCWFVGSTLQGLKDGQKSVSHRISRIEKKLNISEDEDTTL